MPVCLFAASVSVSVCVFCVCVSLYLYPPLYNVYLYLSPCLCSSPGFSIEGPSQAKIECDDKGDGSCDVRYWPTEPGDYAVHVICDDEDIKDSPFMAHILLTANDVFPEKVRPHPFTFTPPACQPEEPE